mgnify:FL=1
MSKVREFLEEKQAAAKKRRADEMGHLVKWQQTQDPVHLKPLLKAYAPIIANAVRRYKAPEVPEPAMRAELTEITIGAFNSYDPNRGAQLNTHVQNQFKKSMRFNGRYQNVGYIPPEQTKWIGPIQRAQADLRDELGRDPDHQEIASWVGEGLRAKMVARVQGNLRADIPASSFEDDPMEHDMARDQEVLSLLPLSLKDRDREVFQHIYGNKRDESPQSGGRVNMGELAKQLGMSSSQISRSHAAIQRAYKSYK